MKFLYKYPHAAFPYDRLVEESRRRGRGEPEFELIDTGIFDDDRYFDVYVEYAKASAEDVLIEITAFNRGPEAAPLHLLPTVWFRNTWSWTDGGPRPALAADGDPTLTGIVLDEPTYGRRWLQCDGDPALLFTENETNTRRLFGAPGPRFAKDGINDAVVDGRVEAINPERRGTKASAHSHAVVPPGGHLRLRLRLTDQPPGTSTEGPFGEAFDLIVRDAPPRSRRILRDPPAGLRHARSPAGDAAGLRRSALVEAVLSLRGEGLD